MATNRIDRLLIEIDHNGADYKVVLDTALDSVRIVDLVPSDDAESVTLDVSEIDAVIEMLQQVKAIVEQAEADAAREVH